MLIKKKKPCTQCIYMYTCCKKNEQILFIKVNGEKAVKKP